ncbi:MAG: PAS domain-containing protein [Oligoflexia bacterium]|nr:PAS domain-containing protein [Oligoflexia bacterium]
MEITRGFANPVDDCIFVVDPTTGLVLDVSPACESALGLPSHKLVGRFLGQWVPGTTREDLANALMVVSRGAGKRVFHLSFRQSSGASVVMEVQASSVFKNSQPVIQLLARASG